MNHKIIVTFLIPLIFIGCSTKSEIDIDTSPKMQVQKKVVPLIKRKGTLYSKRGASLFADKKDLQIGDIIQVLVAETLTNDSKDTRSTSRNSVSGINGGLFAPATTSTSGTQKKLNKINGITGIGFNSSSNNSFKGSATSKADEEFTTTVSAIIEQTYQNGNYFIKGTKEMLINGQKQNIKISGVIRPYDISPENTIYSNQLANLKILYQKDGEEIDSIKKPWGSRFLEAILPF